MEKPQISVIIPAHNEELLLSKCLASLTNQRDAPPFEIIVVDNNSTDETAQIAKAFGARVVHETKPGPTAARNKGVRAAHGSLLILLDADCIAPPHHVARIARWFTANQSHQAAAAAYDYYDASFLIRWAWNKTRMYIWYYQLLRSLFGVQVLIGGNFAIRKSALLSVGGFNERFKDINQSEDTDLAIRLHKVGIDVQFLPMLTVRSSFRRMKDFMFSQQLSRISSHFGYLFAYRVRTPSD